MCGRFSLDKFPKSIIDALDLSDISFNPLTQVYPSNQVDVVLRNENKNVIAPMIWGWKRPFTSRPLINARGRETWEKKTWAKAIRERRCIIPASSFFEWNENQPKGMRDCYRIKPTNEDGFAFGGLYEINFETGEMAMVILTTTPNEKMSEIHHRMPVILDKNQFENWFLNDDKNYINSVMAPAKNESIFLVKES